MAVMILINPLSSDIRQGKYSIKSFQPVNCLVCVRHHYVLFSGTGALFISRMYEQLLVVGDVLLLRVGDVLLGILLLGPDLVGHRRSLFRFLVKIITNLNLFLRNESRSSLNKTNLNGIYRCVLCISKIKSND